jgi:Zonular occludens toxin (Zot)
MKKGGTHITEKTKEIFDIFSPVEGVNTVYYGKVRNGKTYAATADILDLLAQGEVVYANWNIKFEGLDERKSFLRVFVKLISGNRYLYDFKSSNFHYLDVHDPKFITDINNLVGVHLFIDEGQWIFNSHSKIDDPEKRRLILEGGHYCRTLNVITQRPQNILKDIRSQIHFWYKCEKVFSYGKLLRFIKWQIEDMKDDLPLEPEDHKKLPPRKAYWGKKSVFNSYNTHGRRSEDAKLVTPDFEVYDYKPLDKIALLFDMLIPRMLVDRLRRRMQAKAIHPSLAKLTDYKLSEITKDSS